VNQPQTKDLVHTSLSLQDGGPFLEQLELNLDGFVTVTAGYGAARDCDATAYALEDGWQAKLRWEDVKPLEDSWGFASSFDPFFCADPSRDQTTELARLLGVSCHRE
tara:strand:- start:2260 stop:2580 length:321 start_codon:yes stop_codon:yes gene_type:complete